LAEAPRRRITRAFAWFLALAVGVAAGALAQPPGAGSPAWNALPPAERQVLAPLAPEWDKLDARRQQKWRGIAQRYPKMAPEQQQRVQRQMSAWAQLTPAEREAARQRYKSLKSLPPEQRREVRQQWERYQSLPPEKRRELEAKRPSDVAPPSARGVRPAPSRAPPPQLVPGDPSPPARADQAR
jgi:hypothetical protein